MNILEVLLRPTGEAEIPIDNEQCAAGCGLPLGNGEEISGLMGEDSEGLPGFALFHEGCLVNRLLGSL